MLIAVDGTGEADDFSYRQEMHGSFVNSLFQDHWSIRKRYVRGPTLWGLETVSIADRQEEVIHRWLNEGDREIYLVGYSRGGAVAITLAHRLAQANIPVKGMLLFDAVDRARGIDAGVKPGNVWATFHARRDPAVQSRWYFSNCGVISRSGIFFQKFFHCTHSGMGGMPWAGDHPVRWSDPLAKIRENSRAQVSSNPWSPAGRLQIKGPVRASDITIIPTIDKSSEADEVANLRQWMWQGARSIGLL